MRSFTVYTVQDQQFQTRGRNRKEKKGVGTGQYLFECTPSRPPNPPQAIIQRTLEEPKKDFCTAQSTEVFAHTVVADPHCLVSQKYQPSISAFLKYLQSFNLGVLYCIPNEVILGSSNQGREGRTGGIHRKAENKFRPKS